MPSGDGPPVAASDTKPQGTCLIRPPPHTHWEARGTIYKTCIYLDKGLAGVSGLGTLTDNWSPWKALAGRSGIGQ
jgi:hypothetical protein